LTLALLRAAGPLAVENASSGRCPSEAEVIGALTARLGETARGSVRLVYGAAQDDPSRLEIELQIDDRPSLRRRLPAAGSCAALADAIAIIVDRHLRGIGWTEGTPLPGPPRPPPSGLFPRLAGTAGGGGWARWAATATVGAQVRLAEPLALELGVVLPRRSRTEVLATGARVRADGLLARAGLVAAPWRAGPVNLLAGPDLLLTIDAGRGEGLEDARGAVRTSVAAGAQAGVRLPFGGRFALCLSAFGWRRVTAQPFTVGGVGRVLAPPRWQAAALVQLVAAILP
jgi:hypothetical protein